MESITGGWALALAAMRKKNMRIDAFRILPHNFNDR
jgi:hypothetical protein